jgi:hypothetical protein
MHKHSPNHRSTTGAHHHILPSMLARCLISWLCWTGDRGSAFSGFTPLPGSQAAELQGTGEQHNSSALYHKGLQSKAQQHAQHNHNSHAASRASVAPSSGTALYQRQQPARISAVVPTGPPTGGGSGSSQSTAVMLEVDLEHEGVQVLSRQGSEHPAGAAPVYSPLSGGHASTARAYTLGVLRECLA